MAKKYHVTFLYRDFRPYFKEGQEKARAMGLYMQKYCGCIFSEEDRYKKKPKKKLLLIINKKKKSLYPYRHLLAFLSMKNAYLISDINFYRRYAAN